MLRFIDIHVETVGMYVVTDSQGLSRYMRASQYKGCPISTPDFYAKQVCVSVVDVDKQKELCKMYFNAGDGFGAKLLASRGDERTKLTTITGELERILRERYDK